jgi:hypothetical protein
MKHILFASAALLATLYMVAPSWAADPVIGPIGTIDGGYTRTDVHAGGFSDNADTYSLNGSITAPINDRWAYKADLGVDQVNADHDNVTDVTGDAHLLYRANDWIVGGFAGGTKVEDETAWGGGIEAKRDFDKVSIGAATGYGEIDHSDAKVWNVNGDVRFFPAENVRVSAGAGWDRLSGGGLHADAWTENLGAEYQFHRVPVSVFGQYDHADINDLHVRSDAFTVGLRYTFGGASLHDRDRSGADFEGIRNLFSGLNF